MWGILKNKQRFTVFSCGDKYGIQGSIILLTRERERFVDEGFWCGLNCRRIYCQCLRVIYFQCLRVFIISAWELYIVSTWELYIANVGDLSVVNASELFVVTEWELFVVTEWELFVVVALGFCIL